MKTEKTARSITALLSLGLLAGWGISESSLAQAMAKRIRESSPTAKMPGASARKSLKDAPQSVSAKKGKGAQAGPLSPAETLAFTKRFQAEVWPLLSQGSPACTSCHGPSGASQLHFLPGAAENFRHLLNKGYFNPENPNSLLARTSAPTPERRMPPASMTALSEKQIATLRSFVDDLFQKTKSTASTSDEEFPSELLSAFHGKPATTSPDTSFLTYTQLRGKIKTLFKDDWVRDDHDRFQEYLAQFGGADFHTRYNETTKASAPYLSATDALSRDVISKAYLTGIGPFAGRKSLPSPVSMKAPDSAYKAEINRLFRTMLYRDATPAETASAFGLLRAVYAEQKSLANDAHDLGFSLTVTDDQGRATTRDFTVRVTSDDHSLIQELWDQSATTPETKSEDKVARWKLRGPFTLKAGDSGQTLEISNEATDGNVSFAGVEIKSLSPGGETKTVSVTDPSVQVNGAWEQRDENGTPLFEDGNNAKGQSSIVVPLNVPKDGTYEIAVLCRKPPQPEKDDAKDEKKDPKAPKKKGRNRKPSYLPTNVRVEVRSHDQSRLAVEPPAPVPPPGEAHFALDETVDTLDFYDLKTAFQFGKGDGVILTNAGTKKRVVADAVKFEPQNAGPEIVVDNDAAEGREKWKVFDSPGFTPYNVTGPDTITDDNAAKGDLSLTYRPGAKGPWDSKGMYRVLIGFPGQVDNETHAPVIVKARASSPIVRVSYPFHAITGATVQMDASGTYNIQRSPLHFRWTQIGGARVALADPASPKLSFTVAPLLPEQAAWEGLGRALMKHPDFLFTRPRSLVAVKDPATKRRLQLVKIAQDLVARPPTPAEVQKLDKGASLTQMVNGYLESPEFREFYFHRVRLYLESHGGDLEDEPVRLWSYVAFNDRPFGEILTADYTVDENYRKRKRAAYYGHTGLLTMKGFLQGKPGLPHFNYAAQVAEKFLGYVFEVPPEIVAMRTGITATSTTSPATVCYSCHKVLTPLAFQRGSWADSGEYRTHDETGVPIDATDRNLVPSYPFRGNGMEAFAEGAVKKERFIRTMIQTHFIFYFGREMRYESDERELYHRLWENVHANNFQIKPLIRAIVTSPEYLNAREPKGRPGIPGKTPPQLPSKSVAKRVARLTPAH